MGSRHTDRLHEQYLSKDAVKSLLEMFLAASEAQSFRDAVERVFDIVLKMHDYKAAWVFLQDENWDRVSLYAHRGLNPSLVAAEAQTDCSECIIDFVMTTGQVIALKDMAGCKRLLRSIPIDLSEVCCHISLPIKLGWRTVGVLNLGTPCRRNFPVPEIQYLALVAGILSLRLKAERSGGTGQEGEISPEGLRKLVDKMMDGILLMEKDASVTLLNPKGRTFLESFSEIEKGEFFDRFGRIQGQILEELNNCTEELMEYELELSPPGGKILRISCVPLDRTPEGVENAFMVIKDVTREKTIARRARMDARVATVGPLLEGLSHELNNPLAAVSGYLQMLMRKHAKDESVMGIADKMEAELKRAITMVQNLIQMKQVDRSRRRRMEIERILIDLFEEFRPVFDRCNIQAAFAAPRGLPPLLVDVDKITQVFRNIIVNAVQKIEESRTRGTLDIAVQEKEGFVQVIFTDSGPKIFSSKRLFGYAPILREDVTVKDMELSLAYCYSVVQEHDGLLYAQTEGGNLTGFVVELPIPGPGE